MLHEQLDAPVSVMTESCDSKFANYFHFFWILCKK